MQNATFLHGSHDHSFFEELLEGLTPILPGGEKTVEFLGHLFTDLLQIYLLLLVILIAPALSIYIIPVLLVVIPAVASIVFDFILERLFRRYMSPEDLEREEENDMYAS